MRKNTISVDCLFHEDRGLLVCSQNKEAMIKVKNWIISMVRYFCWLQWLSKLSNIFKLLNVKQNYTSTLYRTNLSGVKNQGQVGPNFIVIMYCMYRNKGTFFKMDFWNFSNQLDCECKHSVFYAEMETYTKGLMRQMERIRKKAEPGHGTPLCGSQWYTPNSTHPLAHPLIFIRKEKKICYVELIIGVFWSM